MPNEIVVASLTGSGMDTWALWAKIMAVGATVALSSLLVVFTVALYRNGDRDAPVALHFTLANLCSTAYVASDLAVRLCLMANKLHDVMLPYRISLSAVVLALASMVALHQVLGDRRLPVRRIMPIYVLGALLGGLFWIDDPRLVIASDQFRLTPVGVFADYGDLAAPIFVACLAALAMLSFALLRRARRANGRLLWWMTVFGFTVFFLTGVHDTLRELGLEAFPFSSLTLGCAVFQTGAFAAMAIHYSVTLRDRSQYTSQMRQLEDKASRDPLSGLFNRAYLEKHLDWLPSDATGGLLFIDLDHFKAVNDLYGHDRGDRLIRTVAARIRNTVREQDVACRWGGDEFVVYLSEARSDAALAVAQRLLNAFRHMNTGTPGLDMSASVGFAELTDGNWRTTLERADQALYRAKSEGRNRLAIAS